MIHQLKDKFFKEMAEQHPQYYINLLHPGQNYDIVSTKLDKELIVRKRDTDFVAKVRVRRRIFLFHFEFISKYRRADVRKAYGYSGALSLKYKRDVVTVLFVLKPPSKKPQNLGRYEITPFGQTMNVHSFAVVKLWELRKEILAGKKEYLGLVPILPEISEVVDIDLLKRQRDLLAMVDDPILQTMLRFYTAAFAQAHFKKKDIQTYILEDKKMIEHWEQVPVYGERIKQRVREAVEQGKKQGITQGITQGVKQGVKQGELTGLRNSIMDLLEVRFGSANGTIAKQISRIDNPQKLREFFRFILKSDNLEQVKKTLRAFTSEIRKK